MKQENKITFGSLVSGIRQIHNELASQAGRAVNVSLTLRNWLIGCYIAEYELHGTARAKYGKPNYAAYLLADDNGSSLQMAKYAGKTRVELIENRDFGRCSLVKALKSVPDRFEVENTIFTKIGYPLREEREMINSRAAREAIINAVVHNDYSYGGTPKIEFFSDRVEITSMGGLPYGVSESDFFSGFSIPRNKEIMRVFRDLEIVEQLGSGIPRILEAYSKDVFEIRQSFIRVVLPYAKPLVSLRDMPTQSPDSWKF